MNLLLTICSTPVHPAQPTISVPPTPSLVHKEGNKPHVLFVVNMVHTCVVLWVTYYTCVYSQIVWWLICVYWASPHSWIEYVDLWYILPRNVYKTSKLNVFLCYLVSLLKVKVYKHCTGYILEYSVWQKFNHLTVENHCVHDPEWQFAWQFKFHQYLATNRLPADQEMKTNL